MTPQYPDDGLLRASYGDYLLESAYQPIFSLAHRRAVGYEALVRPKTRADEPVSPLQLFGEVSDAAEVVKLDRLCRDLHAANFAALEAERSWLFLNINPQVVVRGHHYGNFFEAMLTRHGLTAPQVVVEILESEITDELLLADAVQYYRELGCLVAIDDFGAGHSNFDRIVRLAPDLVKLDRSIVHPSGNLRLGHRLVPNLVSLLHEAGCLVLLEGIETLEEASLALDADADFVQGYYFARPAAPQLLQVPGPAFFDELDSAFARGHDRQKRQREMGLADLMVGFDHAVASYEAGVDLDVASFRLLSKPALMRCYALDERGIQIGPSVSPRGGSSDSDPRFAPLYQTDGVNWSRRHYFRRAVAEPGRTQITRPYLSITGAQMCITLSRAVIREDKLRIVCCDVTWDEPPATPQGGHP